MTTAIKPIDDLLKVNPDAIPDAMGSLARQCAELHRTVDRFQAHVAQQIVENPDWWETPLSEGQWFEEFMSFQTSGQDHGEAEEANVDRQAPAGPALG